MTDISISTLSAMIQRSEAEAALARVVSATSSAPSDAESWAARAFVEDLLEMFDAAEASIGQAMILTPSPDLQFKRATIRLKAGHTQAALADAEAVLESGESFFQNEARLILAEAKRRQGRWRDALNDCDGLPDEAEIWCAGLITAGDLRRQCERVLAGGWRHEVWGNGGTSTNSLCLCKIDDGYLQ